MRWETRDAAEVAFHRALDLPPCPNCGGPSETDVLNVTRCGDAMPRFVAGHTIRCARRCWDADPVGYLVEAVAWNRAGRA